MERDAARLDRETVQKKLIELYGHQEFMMIVMDRGMTTLVTTLNRVNHFRYLVFMGNCNGIIGYGKGKGTNFEIAFKNAVFDCKKNLTAIPLDHFQSLTAQVETHYNGTNFYLNPKDFFNSWGSPTLGTMILLSGITHTSFKIIARNRSPYNLVTVLFMSLTRLATPKDLAENIGFKIYHQNFAPWEYTNAKGYFRN